MKLKIKDFKGITLIELVMAVSLLSVIVLTGVSIEMTMRRMNIKPTVQSKLMGELIPVVEMIKKDFYQQIGNVNNSCLQIYNEPSGNFAIRVDGPIGNQGKIDLSDPWHNYSWGGTPAGAIYYSESGNFAVDNETIAYNIFNFAVSRPNNDDTRIKIEIGTVKNPGEAIDSRNNPYVGINTTVFSRMTSGS